VIAWLAQHTDKTTITRLLRTSWETVAGIVTRVVAEEVVAEEGIDERRLKGLLRIGVDEVSYRKGYRFLTVVADHDQAGRVVGAGEGKNAATLEPRTRHGTTRCRASRPEAPWPTACGQPTTCPGPSPLGQEHPVGAAQGPRHPHTHPAASSPRAAPQQVGSVPLLAAQGRPA
jgi:hypothetical protein